MQTHLGIGRKVDQPHARRDSKGELTVAALQNKEHPGVHNKSTRKTTDKGSPLVRGGVQKSHRRKNAKKPGPMSLSGAEDATVEDDVDAKMGPMEMLTRAFHALVGPFELSVLLIGIASALALLIFAPISAAALILPAMLLVFGALFVAFARPMRRPVRAWIPIALGAKLTGKKHWFVRLPLLTGTAVPEEGKKKKNNDPRSIANLELLEVSSSYFRRGRLGGVGVIHDVANETLCIVSPLLDRSIEVETPDRAAAQRSNWNRAIEALLSSRDLIVRVQLTERVVRPLPTIHVLPTEADLAADSTLDREGRRVSPDEVTWPQGPSHDSFVSITINAGDVAPVTKFGADPYASAVDAMLNEVRVVAKGLSAFGFSVGSPLSPGELARFVRVAVDPTVEAQTNREVERQLLLSERASVVSLDDDAPVMVDDNWDFVQFNGSFHRTYWVAEWPSINHQRPGLSGHEDGVLLSPHPLDSLQPTTGGVQISTMIYERAEERQLPLAKLIGAPKKASDVYEPYRYTALMTLSSPSIEHLGYAATEFESEALQNGFEFRALGGRHDVGFIASMPFSRAL